MQCNPVKGNEIRKTITFNHGVEGSSPSALTNTNMSSPDT